MENLSHSSPDLEEVKVEFQAWRSQQTIGRRIIPQLLWHKAIALLKTYPLTLVVRELGLSRDRLLSRLHQFQETALSSTSVSTTNPQPTFLEISSSDLNNLITSHHSSPSPSPSPNPNPSPNPSPSFATNILSQNEENCRIVIEKSDGSRLSLQLSTNFSTLQAICNTFLKG